MKFHTCIAGLSIVLGFAACNESVLSIQTLSQHRFEVTDSQTLYDAAHATMREYFRIDQADSRTGIIRSVPTIVPAELGVRPLGRPLSSPMEVRKIAEIRIEPLGGGMVVRCGVLVQRSEFTDRLIYASQRTIDDTPNKTPLQETEGRLEHGNVTWSTTGYDRKLERELLAAIAERQAKTQQE